MAIVPEKPIFADQTKATILAPDGTIANFPTLMLTGEEAILLRQYKKFLLQHHLREATFCNDCWDMNRPTETKFIVTPDFITFHCHCRHLFFKGPTL